MEKWQPRGQKQQEAKSAKLRIVRSDGNTEHKGQSVWVQYGVRFAPHRMEMCKPPPSVAWHKKGTLEINSDGKKSNEKVTL